MDLDESKLLQEWVRFTSLDALADQQVPTGLNDAGRRNVAEELRAAFTLSLDAGQKDDARDETVERVGLSLARQAMLQNLDSSVVTSETNALCLALYSVISSTGADEEIGTSRQLRLFIDRLPQAARVSYQQEGGKRGAPPVRSNAPDRPESLQHALRLSPQGAMLFLDLMREDVQRGEVSLEDVDSAIDSLKNVVKLLDSYRDSRTDSK